MPASATITSSTFYVFSPNERPRIGKMNSNFSALRGHLIPIDPNTVSSSNLSADLGSEDYRWRSVYARKLDLSITTTALTIEANTAGNYLFKTGASTTATITDTGFVSGYNKTPFAGATTSAALGQLAQSSAILDLTITGAGHVAGSTATIAVSGRPVLVTLQPDLSATSTSSHIRSWVTGEALTGVFSADICLVRNGSITSAINFSTNRNDNNVFMPPSFFRFTDFPSAGSCNYSLYITAPGATGNAGTATTAYVILSNVKLVAFELQ